MLTVAQGGVLTIGVVLAIYFASNGVESLRVGLNRAYGVVEKRRWYWLRLELIGYTLLAAVASAVARVPDRACAADDRDRAALFSMRSSDNEPSHFRALGLDHRRR